MAPIPILLNAAAGSAGGESSARLRDALAGAPLLADIRAVPGPEIAREAARLAAAGAPVVGVRGGDGSVSSAAGALADTRTTLAVFPGGTLNHFAAALGIRTDADALCAIQRGRAVAVDVGEVNGRVFINGASIGIYPRQLRLRARWERRWGKWPAASAAALIAWARIHRGRVLVQGDGIAEAAHAPLLWVGPGRGSFRLPGAATGRALRSGTLELVMLRSPSRTRLLRLALRAFTAGGDALRVVQDAEDCTVHHGKWLNVTARRTRVDVGIDGELARLPAPLEFRIRPGALRVFVGDDAPL